ncbi:hypothetical protein [Methylophaga muralis]|uniref:tRNA-specific adenosine deaminase n=1 Tax=Methylophaga muralis TaxID=291169 RepID=A0A1E3GSG2_9GAMM|nr:hypothetical protein [Methylophaga muralis]ODN66989.1 hypothetical protein A9E74_01383 [Methylophaga muralis]
MTTIDYKAMLEVAINEARQGLAEGGIPIGAAVFNKMAWKLSILIRRKVFKCLAISLLKILKSGTKISARNRGYSFGHSNYS